MQIITDNRRNDTVCSGFFFELVNHTQKQSDKQIVSSQLVKVQKWSSFFNVSGWNNIYVQKNKNNLPIFLGISYNYVSTLIFPTP